MVDWIVEMLQVYIPAERAKALKRDKRVLASMAKACRCRIEFAEDDAIEIESDDKDAYAEFNAKNVIYAYGRGFEPRIAETLVHDDKYFSAIDLGAVGNSKRVGQIKARIIGESGKTKNYIESVSGARMAVHGDMISFIGTYSEIEEAEVAVKTLIEGGTHRVAYAKMEAAHRKNKAKPF